MGNHAADVYWLDCLSRGLANRDLFTRLFPLDDLAQSAEAGLYRSPIRGALYDRVSQEILDHVTITHGSQVAQPSTAVFHSHFGWTVECEFGKAHLGSLSYTSVPRIQVGVRSYISGSSSLFGNGEVAIGSYSSLASELALVTSNNSHPTRFPSTYNFGGNARMVADGISVDVHAFQEDNRVNRRRDIRIGHDTWIGRDVCIMNGLQIGNGCVIGTRALVTRDCDPYGIYGGTPARLIRYRFNDRHIEELNEIAWWDWSIARIARNTVFFDTDLEQFDNSLFDLIVG